MSNPDNNNKSKMQNCNDRDTTTIQTDVMNRYFYKAVVALNNSGVNLLQQQHGHCIVDAIDTFRDAINIINTKFYKTEAGERYSFADVQETIHRASQRSAKASTLQRTTTRRMEIDNNGKDDDDPACLYNIKIVNQQQTNPLHIYEQLMINTTIKNGVHCCNSINMKQACITVIYMDDTTTTIDYEDYDNESWFINLDVLSSTLLYNYAQAHWYFAITNRHRPNKTEEATVALYSTYRIFQLAESVTSKFFNNHEEMYYNNDSSLSPPSNGMLLVSVLLTYGIMQTSYVMNLPSIYQDQQLILQELIHFIQEQNKLYPYYTEPIAASAA